MSQHVYKEYRHYPENDSQDFKCQSCGKITNLPAAMKPTDYHQEVCDGVNSKPVQKLQPDILLPTQNRHDRRASRVQEL